MLMYTMSEARAALARILDEVERGESVTITRHGRPAAQLIAPRTTNPAAADLFHAANRLAVELDEARSRPLSAPVAGGPTADELVAALRADRDSW
jgi:prevent-host-death family protein